MTVLLIQSQHIHANGLQDPVLGQGLNFAICLNVLFVQILHYGNLHWVAISAYGCNPREVFLMVVYLMGASHIIPKNRYALS